MNKTPCLTKIDVFVRQGVVFSLFKAGDRLLPDYVYVFVSDLLSRSLSDFVKNLLFDL